MSSKKPGSKFVSCFKLHGVPLLPPILSEEEKVRCRLYQKEAMLIEKELELKRKEKELERLKAVYESSSSNSSLQSKNREDSDEWSVNILSFMVKAVCDNASNLEEFKFLFNEVSKELKKELKNRGYLKTEASKSETKSRNCDSTCHEVDNITLNQNQDGASSSGSILQDMTCFDKDSDNNSVICNNESCHSRQSPRNMSSHSSKEEPILHKNLLVTGTPDVSGGNFPHYINESQNQENNLNGLEETHASIPIQVDDEFVDGMQTPPRLIRSNSYTLDSPSPSVLEYLRNLSVAQSSEKVADSDLLNKHDTSTPKSVVRNLNKLWGDKNTLPLEFPCNVNVIDNSELRLAVEDKNENFIAQEKVNIPKNLPTVSGPVGGNAVFIENSLPSLNHVSLDREKKQKAAVTIQAAARGFLVRRLMKTFRVDTIKNTIKDAVLCAWELYEEQSVTPSDLNLHERLIQQVTAACYELHSIFFKWSTAEKMALIRSDREKQKNPKPKFRPSRSNSESESRSSSRSTSRSRSRSTVVTTKKPEKVTDRNGSGTLKRPTTLSVRKPTSTAMQTWR